MQKEKLSNINAVNDTNIQKYTNKYTNNNKMEMHYVQGDIFKRTRV